MAIVDITINWLVVCINMTVHTVATALEVYFKSHDSTTTLPTYLVS